jgi:hypothetical protein
MDRLAQWWALVSALLNLRAQLERIGKEPVRIAENEVQTEIGYDDVISSTVTYLYLTSHGLI